MGKIVVFCIGVMVKQQGHEGKMDKKTFFNMGHRNFDIGFFEYLTKG